MTKAAHVKARARGYSGFGHTCHWPGCNAQVPPAYWGCRTHWFMLPAAMRAAIWTAYRPGQEEDKNPSVDYIKAAGAAQDWIAEQERIRLETARANDPRTRDLFE